MGKCTLGSFGTVYGSTATSTLSGLPTEPHIHYISPDHVPGPKDEFRHLVMQTYKETYNDEGSHPHPIFT